MARQKSSEKELYWRDIVNRQSRSGLSVRQFCAHERVSEHSFYGWRRKLRGRKDDGRRPAGSVDEPTNGQEFIPLKLLNPSGALEVIHPLGYRVRVTGEVNKASLQLVLDILDGRSAG